MKSNTHLRLLASGSLALLLSACGSGDSGSSDPALTPLNPSPSGGNYEADPPQDDTTAGAGASVGKWRFTFATDSRVSAGETELSAGRVTASRVFLVEEHDADSVAITSCTSREREIVPNQDMNFMFGAEDEADLENCSSDDSRIVGAHDGKFALIESFCGEMLVDRAEWVLVSDDPTFSSDNFSFNSSQFPDATRDDGVCGEITVYDHEISAPEAEGTAVVVNEIKVVMPYGESLLQMTIHAQNLRGTGEYSIGPIEASDGLPRGGVSARLMSAEFGTTVDGPIEVSAESGTVKIVELSDLASKVEFDLVTDTGDEVSGSFAINLK